MVCVCVCVCSHVKRTVQRHHPLAQCTATSQPALDTTEPLPHTETTHRASSQSNLLVPANPYLQTGNLPQCLGSFVVSLSVDIITPVPSKHCWQSWIWLCRQRQCRTCQIQPRRQCVLQPTLSNACLTRIRVPAPTFNKVNNLNMFNFDNKVERIEFDFVTNL